MNTPEPTPRPNDYDAAQAQLETLLALKDCMQELHAQLEYLRLMLKLKQMP